MGTRLHSWWLHRKTLVVTLILIIVSVGVIVLIVLGYLFKWDWTGFNEHVGPNVQQYQPGKTLWDWLQLLIIPLVLAVAALLFNLANSRTEQKIAAQRYEQDQQIALDKQRQDLLQAYLDRMTALLLDKDLRSSQPDAEVRNVARARTLTVLTQLDTNRQRSLLQFLSESQLLKIINLSGAQLNDASLYRVNLSGVNLNYAAIRDANLYEADLREANLRGADLNRASLVSADLRKANLSGAHMTGADLGDADLGDAKLLNAKVTDEQLEKAKSLKGATMPDGSIHR